MKRYTLHVLRGGEKHGYDVFNGNSKTGVLKQAIARYEFEGCCPKFIYRQFKTLFDNKRAVTII